MKRTLTTLAITLFGAAAFAKGTHGGKPAACYVGGCSSQLCTDDPNAMSTCIWKDEYICYSDAICERQRNGQCGWTQTKELKKCLKNPPQPEPEPTQCYVGGCSGQVCSEDADMVTDCMWKDEYICYSDATCEKQKNGKCGWTQTKELKKCLKNPPQPEPEPTQCYVGGCSGQVCSEDADVVTDCMWRDEYICYNDATCEKQKNGKCGWTQTKELKKCLKNPPQPAEPELTPCQVGGCSGQICSEDADVVSTCEWRDEYMCYSSAVCERQKDGQCGWTSTPAFNECMANPPQPYEPEPLPDKDACYVTGCSGQICSSESEGMATTCEWREEYACYQMGKCERQKDGECGWTSTPELNHCLANPPSNAV